MKKLLTVLVAALAVSASPAYAVTLVNPDGSRAEPFQTWADRSRVPTPKTTVTIRSDASECPAGADGCMRPGAIWIGMDGCLALGDRGYWCQAILHHELGHQLDFEMHPRWRLAFTRSMRMPDEWWGKAKPAETFAEAASYCARGRTPWSEGIEPGVSRGHLYAPTRRQHRRACSLVRRAAAEL